MHDFDDTIAAPATAPGKAAIAIVRVSGPNARSLASRLFDSREPLEPRVARYGTILDESGTPLDRGLVLFFPAPHSYTGEDCVEFHTHGSPVIVRELLRALLACGARYAGPGEFTRRAFFNEKIDLHGAGAVADLIDAESRAAARAALANLGGGLAQRVRVLRARLAAVLEELAAAVDFPDEVPDPDRAQITAEIDGLSSALRKLQRDAEVGRLVREGIPVAIIGPPNAGKSSLLNALLGEERAIVSEIPGTTRDTVEESITVRGLQLRLIDTAGIRAHADRLENAGIERTRRALEGARVALVVVDGSIPLTTEAQEILEQTAHRERVVFASKADLGDAGARMLNGYAHVNGSVYDASTVERLREALATTVLSESAPDLSRPHLASVVELDSVSQALAALEQAEATLTAGHPIDLLTADLQRAHAALGRVTGENALDELLSGIFSRFCIGK